MMLCVPRGDTKPSIGDVSSAEADCVLEEVEVGTSPLEELIGARSPGRVAGSRKSACRSASARTGAAFARFRELSSRKSPTLSISRCQSGIRKGSTDDSLISRSAFDMQWQIFVISLRVECLVRRLLIEITTMLEMYFKRGLQEHAIHFIYLFEHVYEPVLSCTNKTSSLIQINVSSLSECTSHQRSTPASTSALSVSRLTFRPTSIKG